MAIDPQWADVKEIFSRAVAEPGDRREAFVAAACAARPQVAAAVVELLRAHDEASTSFLQNGTLALRTAWTFRPGDVVAGRFRVVRVVARGAMGEVYAVFDERLGIAVALKAIRPELLADPHAVDRMRREVRVTREITHDGLCRVFDLVEHVLPASPDHPPGITLPCLTMQLLEGESLDDWLRRARPVARAEALRLARQIAEALDTLHAARVVHRDLKPSNVMLVPGSDGVRAVLTDFGLARPLREELFETQGTAQGGAPYYMAPELFRGDRPSIASDVYAFALLVDEMVTDGRAFRADSLHGLLLEKLNGSAISPLDRSHDLPPSWVAAIERGLARDPADRFERATGFVAALDGHGPALQRRHRRLMLAPAGAALMSLSTITVGDLPRGFTFTPSVVVVPFTDKTGQAADAYLARSTSDEVARRLARLAGWRVFAPRDADAEAQVTPAERATFALRGDVTRVGAGFRISAEVAEIVPGHTVWRREYTGKRSDVIAMEARLASEALEALTAAAQRRRGSYLLDRFRRWLRPDVLPPQGTAVPDAYDAYQRGRYLLEERTLDAAMAAAQLYRRAAALDPAFAAPHAGLADVQAVLMDLHYAPHDALLRQGEAHARQALALDPALPEALVSLAAIRQAQSRWQEAEEAYRHALDLHPGFARAHRWYGGMLLQFNRLDEAFARYERALALDPYDVPSQSAYGLALFYGRRPNEAVQHLENLVARREHAHARFILGQVHASLATPDRPDAATALRRALDQAEALRRQRTEAADRFADLVTALAWSYQGRKDNARPALDRLVAGQREGRTSPSFAARVYGAQGDAGPALDALEAAEREGDRELMYLLVSPLYDRIRHQDRFVALTRRLSLVH